MLTYAVMEERICIRYANLFAFLREAAKKFLFRGPAGKRERVKVLATKEKNDFFEALKNPTKNKATKLEGGSKALVAGPLKKNNFFAASIIL